MSYSSYWCAENQTTVYVANNSDCRMKLNLDSHKACEGETVMEMEDVVRESEVVDSKIQARVQEGDKAKQTVEPGRKRGRPRKTRPDELEVLEGTKESGVLRKVRQRRKIKAKKKGGLLGIRVPNILQMVQPQLNTNLFGSSSDRLLDVELEMVQPDMNSLKPQLDMNLFGSGSSGVQSQTSTDLHNTSPCKLPPSQTQLPFVKKSSLWEILESMEVFKIMPQKPHFRPLEQFTAGCREGKAIGHLVNFVNLASKVCDARFDDTDSFKDKMELLENLEQHGFCVQPLRARLEALLELKERHGVFENELTKIEAGIHEQEHEQDELIKEIVKLDMETVVLKESIALLRGTRDHIIIESKISESEIEKWEKERHLIKEQWVDAKREFDGLLATI
ncbi:hypothetical protein H6P81_001710 [Aristolochia fimbriata]|uniref:Uncharacterized protein n=1 Tax=Aristolochia fimbriata TaxID=158543 RepID=A0AAV7FBP7_ARIFI|nr:hypothetical protein H6P81_001710 [Aristolochia fimbriata]